jgi:hypothetical protein
LLDILEKNLLFEIDPADTERLTRDAKATYGVQVREIVEENTIDITVPEVVQYIRDYAKWCTPVRIESLVKHAIKSGTVSPGSGKDSQFAESARRTVAAEILQAFGLQDPRTLSDSQLAAFYWAYKLSPAAGEETKEAVKTLPKPLTDKLVKNDKVLARDELAKAGIKTATIEAMLALLDLQSPSVNAAAQAAKDKFKAAKGGPAPAAGIIAPAVVPEGSSSSSGPRKPTVNLNNQPIN